MALNETDRTLIRAAATMRAGELLKSLEIDRSGVSNEAYAQIVALYEGVEQLSRLLRSIEGELKNNLGEMCNKLDTISDKLDD